MQHVEPIPEVQLMTAAASCRRRVSVPEPATGSKAKRGARKTPQTAGVPSGAATLSAQNGTGQASAAFTFDEAKRRRLNSILQHYVGTHNFHNFTIRVHSSDPSAKRFIRSFKCEDLVYLEVRCQIALRMQLRGSMYNTEADGFSQPAQVACF